MKKSIIKTLATLTLALSLVFTGAAAADAAVSEDANYGIMLLHDGPHNSTIIR